MKAIAERCRLDCDKLHRSGSHDVALENAAIAGELEAALASLLTPQEGTTISTPPEFADGYSQAVTDVTGSPKGAKA